MIGICKGLGVSLGESLDDFVKIPERTPLDDAIELFLSDKTEEEKEWALDLLKVLFKSK